MNIFRLKRPVAEPGPITRYLLRTAATLGMHDITMETSGFLAQARMIDDLASRVVDLERRLAETEAYLRPLQDAGRPQ